MILPFYNGGIVLIRFLFGIVLFAAAWLGAEEAAFEVGAPWEWVKPVACEVEGEHQGGLDENVHWILIDGQVHREDETAFRRRVFQVLTAEGVREHAQLEVDFDPEYQRVVMHSIRVYRGGVWEERLERTRSRLVQRESGLDRNLVDGRKSLIFFLDDVRVGDVVEYAYSVIGVNPNFSDFLDQRFFLEGSGAIDRKVCRLLADPGRGIRVKGFNTEEEFAVVDLPSGLREWSWEGEGLKGCPYKSSAPAWYFPIAHVQMSQYESWAQVANKVYSFYDLSNFGAPSEAMLALKRQWEGASVDPKVRALLALRFVQDEVRYLGFEEGAGGHKPRDPNLVFERRYGDCKDKALLLQYLLQEMDISSTVALVQTRRGKGLNEALPGPYLFNHVVLKIVIGEEVFWVDPTISLQGGSLEELHFPSYHWALEIAVETTALTPIPEPNVRPIELEASYEVISEDEAVMAFVSRRRGVFADRIRGYLDYKGRKAFSEKALEGLQRIYGAAEEEYPLQINDDRDENLFVVTQCYRVPLWKYRDESVLEVVSRTIRDYLDTDLNPKSGAPYALSYPIWIQEHIHVENPFGEWNEGNDDEVIEHPSFYFKFSEVAKGHQLDQYFELKYLQDHVPVDLQREYWNKTKGALRLASLDLSIITSNGDK